MANQVTLTFAGDDKGLRKTTRSAADALQQTGTAATSASRQMATAGESTADLSGRLGKLGAATDGASTALSDAGGALQAVVDLQQAGAERASRLARALLDVEQAQEDYNQALRDSRQAAIDANQATVDREQAELDAATALRDYNDAVKEHGRNSLEARQAQIDLKQAGVDLAQANEDAAQATRDGAQAAIDAKSAQQDLTDAQREANPPDLQKWADQLNLISPLLSAVVGVVALVTAAQWAWNVALAANPIGLVVLAVAALVAGIVLIATKTTWFQDLWRVSWGWIKRTAASVWDWLMEAPGKLGRAFGKVGNLITSPFRSAFNAVARAWNATVGSLSWTVPGWVPFVGGNSISAPRLPTFHTGGVASGAMGREFLAVLRAGETVDASGGTGPREALRLEVAGGSGGDTSRLLAQLIAALIAQGYLRLRVANDRVTAGA